MGSNPVAAVVVVDEKPSVVNEASQPPVTPAPASAAASATSVTSEGSASNNRYEIKELPNLANRSCLKLCESAVPTMLYLCLMPPNKTLTCYLKLVFLFDFSMNKEEQD